MDWSKAKNILIIALIAVNVFLGVRYFEAREEAERDEVLARRYTAEYVTQLGVSIECGTVTYEKKLPVLFVSIEEGEGEQKPRDGMRIIVTGAGGLRAVSPEAGGNAGDIISPEAGLLKLSCGFGGERLNGLVISGAELVYLVDRAGLDTVGGRDTAVPAWEFTTSDGVFYVSAFEQ